MPTQEMPLPSHREPHPDPLSDERQEHIEDMVAELRLAEGLMESFMRIDGPSSGWTMTAGRDYHRVQRRLVELLMEPLS